LETHVKSVAKRKYVNLPKGKRLIKKRVVDLHQARSMLVAMVEQTKVTSGRYFWTPPHSASSRRHMEDQNTVQMSIQMEWLPLTVKYFHALSVSCRHVYRDVLIYHNGKKVTMARVNRLIDEIDDFLEQYGHAKS